MRHNALITLATVGLLVGVTACKKPAPAPVVDRSAEDAKKAELDAKRKAEEDAKRKAEEDAKRKAEEAKRISEADRKRAEKEAFRNAVAAALKDINFDYDKSAIREIDKTKLQAIADFLRKYPDVKLRLEGNCDERGTVEYNLALGDRRAVAAKDYLKGLGVSDARLSTISYGKERPKVQGKDEESYLINRRCEFKQQ